MIKILEKQVELEALEVAVEALESRREWAERDIQEFEAKEEEISDYERKNYERKKLLVRKYNELIEKLENMI